MNGRSKQDIWVTPLPLWPSDATRPFPEPAILSYTGEDFVEALQKALARPASLGDRAVAGVPGRNRSDICRTRIDPATVPKLYQPAHRRFYLIAASLVRSRPGFPDGMPGKEEAARFVVRRLDGEGEEAYRWMTSGERLLTQTAAACVDLTGKDLFERFRAVLTDAGLPVPDRVANPGPEPDPDLQAIRFEEVSAGSAWKIEDGTQTWAYLFKLVDGRIDVFGTGIGWERLPEASAETPVSGDEETYPLFSLPYRFGLHRRQLWFGLLPAASREPFHTPPWPRNPETDPVYVARCVTVSADPKRTAIGAASEPFRIADLHDPTAPVFFPSRGGSRSTP